MRTLYIEGTSETDNGDLRKAFSSLLSKETILKGKMPRIIMGDGKNQTIDKFHSTPILPGEIRFLLFDSDVPNPNKAEICKEINDAKPNRKVDATTENTFLMIQEVEAWLLSQPDVLESSGVDMSKFHSSNVETIKKPSVKLAELYRHSGMVYTKVSEFVRVFPKLNSKKLKESCTEYQKLIDKLSK